MSPSQFLAGLRRYLIWQFSRTGQSTAQVFTIVKKENDRIAKGGKVEDSSYYDSVAAFLASPVNTGIYPTIPPAGQAGAMSNEEFLRGVENYYRFSGQINFGNTAPADIDKYIRSVVDTEKARLQAGGTPETSMYWQQVSYQQRMYEQAMELEPVITLSQETYAGNLFLVPRDAEGNIIGNSQYFTSLGKAEAGGLTAWQQAQIDQTNKEFAYQQQQDISARQQAMMPYGQMTAYERAQMGLQQQAYAAQTAALPSEGWIEQWFRNNPQALQTGVTPPRYHTSGGCPAGMSQEEYMRRFIQTSKKAVDVIKQWETGGLAPGTIGNIEMPLPGNWVYMESWKASPSPKVGMPQPITTNIKGRIPISMLSSAAPQAAIPQYMSRPAEIGYQPVKYQAGKTKKTTTQRYTGPRTPPAPPWLSQFVPGQVTGRPITKTPITTPSGQQWAATPPTIQGGLAGYGTWAGYPMEDILAQMQRMQPQTPYGAGYQRYSPVYQY